MKSPCYYNIALPTPLNQLFTYLPNPKNPPPKPGSRVYVPFGRRFQVGVLINTSIECNIPHHKLKPIQQVLDQDQPSLDDSILKLCQWSAQYYHHSLGEVVFEALPKVLRNMEQKKPYKVWRLTELGKNTQLEALNRAKKQKELLTLIKEQKPDYIDPKDAQYNAFASVIYKQLQHKKILELVEIENIQCKNTNSDKINAKKTLKEPELALNEQQYASVNSIKNQLATGFFVSLVDGVTGSGKTEIYLQLINEQLNKKKQILILVPEIGLTPQTINRFIKRFNASIKPYHSGLTDKERHQVWQDAKEGIVDIIIGTRSALFIPMPQLAMIVVDEEHDSSFKQQEGFRYNARDLAIIRGQIQNAPVILGSATPSLESYYNAFRQRYNYYRLEERAGYAKKPSIKLVDPSPTHSQNELTPIVIAEIKSHLQQNNQVLIFVNRRGYAPVLICQRCQWMAQCPSCDAYLSVHSIPLRLHCHHCDLKQKLPSQCPDCQHQVLNTIGLGTQKSELLLKDLFPDTVIIRVDRDVMQKRDAFKNTVDYINQGESCILVGTQMLAKGHHFPNVTLVVILNCDQGFYSADFRGFERTGQLITQVSGRAGRAEKPGQVIIQTQFSNDPRLNLLITKPYHEFAQQQLAQRKLTHWPPYSYLAIIRADSTSAEVAMEFLTGMHVQLTQVIKPGGRATDLTPLRLQPPMPALMEKRSGRYRALMVLHSSSRKQLHGLLNRAVEYVRQHLKSSIRCHIDVDPQEFY